MAAKIALATPHRKAAVIGCGVIGLTTARLLQNRASRSRSMLPTYRRTTSDVAAGAFGVTEIVNDDHHSDENARRIAEAVRFATFAASSPRARYGVRPMDMYMLGAQPKLLGFRHHA